MGTLTDNPPTTSTRARAYCFAQSVSHLDPAAPKTKFCQRYWINAQWYKPGGPVFVMDTGEGAGDRLVGYSISQNPALWAKKYNGIAIVLEHRYYGWSMPVPDLTTDNLRWLTTKESLEDTANFIRTWLPPAGLITNYTVDRTVLDPKNTPWIMTGCSYPGGRAAWLRTQYPDLVYGAVSSSGVTVAKAHFSEYFHAIQAYGPQPCIKKIQDAVEWVDNLLDQGGEAANAIKTYFGLGELSNNADFAQVLADPPCECAVADVVDAKGCGRVSTGAMRSRLCATSSAHTFSSPATPSRATRSRLGERMSLCE
ncbi:hypothetical protein VHUM_04050 [Vanrija humicola]|uniref:Uncharacterized protein n=1 Tax=Vanrija humicola TaxID=5417 RepID=A0A7D8YZ72_VANHU|nr:hypothetical protein VHUM_04050 [Vanrija humicola]